MSKERKEELAQHSGSTPNYEFTDYRSDYREGLRYSDGKYVVYNMSKDKSEVSQILDKNGTIFSCQGWHYYLIENLEILEKQEIELKLLLPSELDSYTFKVKHAKTTGNLVIGNLKLSNWLLGFFAPNLRLTYDKQLKKMIEYNGISNILDTNGERKNVTIRYLYD